MVPLASRSASSGARTRAALVGRTVAIMKIEGVKLLEGLTEAALIAGSGRVLASNSAARGLLGTGIDGDPLAQAIAHPAAIDALNRSSPDSPTDVELTGLGDSRRHWLMRTAKLVDG